MAVYLINQLNLEYLRVDVSKDQRSGGQSSKFDFAYYLYIGRPRYYNMKSRFIWLNIVSFQRNLNITVNGIFRRNNLENCQLSRSY